MPDWFYDPQLVKDELGLDAIPLAEASRPEVIALIKDTNHHYKELRLGSEEDSSDGVPLWAWDLWGVVHGENEMEHVEGALNKVQSLSPPLQVFVATVVAAQLFEGDWWSRGGQVTIEMECDTDNEALVVETVIRAAEAAGIIYAFVPQH